MMQIILHISCNTRDNQVQSIAFMSICYGSNIFTLSNLTGLVACQQHAGPVPELRLLDAQIDGAAHLGREESFSKRDQAACVE
jgi:hypothetical protein